MLTLTDKIAMAADPVRLARAAGLTPDDWQGNLLRSQAKRIMLLCSRQVGKSTTTALVAAHTARYQPGAQILLLAPAQRQAQELLRTIQHFWHQLNDPSVTAKADTLTRMEMSNGSRILALPGSKGDTIRGLASISLVIVDEAARVTAELIAAARPMLAISGGRLILLSTPCGARGWFYDEWQRGEGYQRFKVKAEECPRISKEFLASERVALGPWYEQEYNCSFLTDSHALFRPEDIERLFDNEEEPWDIKPPSNPHILAHHTAR